MIKHAILLSMTLIPVLSFAEPDVNALLREVEQLRFRVQEVERSQRISEMIREPRENDDVPYGGGDARRPRQDALGQDNWVGVTTNSKCSWLGLTYNTGVLQTDGSISYDVTQRTNDYDYVTLGVDVGWFGTNVTNYINESYDLAPFTNAVREAQTNDGTGTDDQVVDTFSLAGNTLSISLEDDGEAPHTVDLSSYLTNYMETDPYFVVYSNSAAFTNDVRAAQTNDGTGTDDQAITAFSISDDVLTLTIEDGGSSNVDLSAYLDDTDTTNHSALSELAWTDSGHTGTALRVAAFDSVGAATYLAYSNWDAAFGWGDHALVGYLTNYTETDPYFVAYSNSIAFTNDVRSAQTNDGFEADTTYLDDLATFTNYVRSAQTNDGTGTDNQTVDMFSITDNILSLSLEDDGQIPVTVDLSAYTNDTDTTYLDDLPAFTNAVRSAQTNDGFEADTDELVKVDAGAVAGYIGSTATDGVLRADETLSYTDGGNYVILGVSSNWFSTNVTAIVSNMLAEAEAEACNQNTHPDDDVTDYEDGTDHPNDDDDGTYPGGGDDEDDGTGHPSDTDCYSTVPDPLT